MCCVRECVGVCACVFVCVCVCMLVYIFYTHVLQIFVYIYIIYLFISCAVSFGQSLCHVHMVLYYMYCKHFYCIYVKYVIFRFRFMRRAIMYLTLYLMWRNK